MPPGPDHPRPLRMIVAISVGNAFEWYDFVIFGYFAIALSNQFFPERDPASALLFSFATFGAAFVMRPFGAIVLGRYADRRGRKPALIAAISLMTLGTALIAFAPTHASIGTIAPFVVLVGRLIQGFSAGGEFGSATALLAEQGGDSRGFLTSWQFCSQAISAVLATSVGTILTTAIDARDLNDWGWRIPFAVGVLIGPIAIYVRHRIPESVEFESTKSRKLPTREIARQFGAKMITAIGLVVLGTVAVYTLVFMPTFATRFLGLAPRDAFVASLLTGVVQAVLIPLGGAASDRWGRLIVARIAAMMILISAIPLLAMVGSAPTFERLLTFQVWIGGNAAIFLGVLPATMSELFPTQLRTTGLSVSYSLAVAIFGGFAPFINAYLIDLSGSNVAPAYYLSAAAVISLVALFTAGRVGIR